MIMPYCVAISCYPFLTNGLQDLGGLSAKPKNLDSFCGMFCNLVFAVSAQFAGAIATGEFLMYFDYFARKEWGNDYWKRSDEFIEYGSKLKEISKSARRILLSLNDLKSYSEELDENDSLKSEVKDLLSSYKDGKLSDGSRTIGYNIHQKFQQIVYTLNQPAAARNFQSTFWNISYFDRYYFDGLFHDFVFPDGTAPIWESLSWVQKDFMKWFNEERTKAVLTFPRVYHGEVA